MIDKRKTLFGAFWIVLWLAGCGPPKRVWTYRDMGVGLLSPGSEGGWRAANIADFKDAAVELGISLKFQDPQARVQSQYDGFRQFLGDPQVNVIVLAALERTGWEELLREAKAAGKIVILEDRRIDAPEDLYTAFVGSDFAEQGRKAGAEMCRLLEGGEAKNVWELTGVSGSSYAADRGRGFREAAGECGIAISLSQPGNWTAPEGKAVMETWLAQGSSVQGIFAQNDEMGLGAIEALKAAGIRPGVDVAIVSIDATLPAFEAMLAGELNAAVDCNPLLARQVYAAALQALNGKAVPKWIRTQDDVFRSDMPDLREIAAGRKY